MRPVATHYLPHPRHTVLFGLPIANVLTIYMVREVETVGPWYLLIILVWPFLCIRTSSRAQQLALVVAQFAFLQRLDSAHAGAAIAIADVLAPALAVGLARGARLGAIAGVRVAALVVCLLTAMGLVAASTDTVFGEAATSLDWPSFVVAGFAVCEQDRQRCARLENSVLCAGVLMAVATVSYLACPDWGNWRNSSVLGQHGPWWAHMLSVAYGPRLGDPWAEWVGGGWLWFVLTLILSEVAIIWRFAGIDTAVRTAPAVLLFGLCRAWLVGEISPVAAAGAALVVPYFAVVALEAASRGPISVHLRDVAMGAGLVDALNIALSWRGNGTPAVATLCAPIVVLTMYCAFVPNSVGVARVPDR